MDVAAVAIHGLFHRGSSHPPPTSTTNKRRKATTNDRPRYLKDASLYDQLLQWQEPDEDGEAEGGQQGRGGSGPGALIQKQDGDDDDDDQDQEEEEEEEEDEDLDDDNEERRRITPAASSSSSVASTTSSKQRPRQGNNKKRARPAADTKLSKEEYRYLTRRNYLCPQGAWPIPHTSTAATASSESASLSYVEEALPEDVPVKGVRHYVPRIDTTSIAAAAIAAASSNHKQALGIEWLPMENLQVQGALQEAAAAAAIAAAVAAANTSTASTASVSSSLSPAVDLSSLYPVPSPAITRLLDGTILKRLAGITTAVARRKSGGADAEEEEEEEEADEEKVYLHDLVKAASEAFTTAKAPRDNEQEDDDEGERDEREDITQRQIQQKKEENVHLLRQCLGREVERMVDSLLGHVLVYWAEREAAHRSDPDYLATLQQERAKGPAAKKHVDDIIAFGNRSVTLGDWRDMLEAVEVKAAVESAVYKKQKVKARREERVFMKYGKKKKTKEDKVYLKVKRKEATREEKGEEARLLLRPVLDVVTLHRTRNRLETLFVKKQGQGNEEKQEEGQGKNKKNATKTATKRKKT